jgi:Domain of unknown function (DUF4115)
MFVVLVVGLVLLAALLLGFLVSRPKHETILDHQRALAALREAERPRESSPAEAHPVVILTDHVHILDGPPAGKAGARKRPAARRQPAARRRTAADLAERPTIASLPTMGYFNTIPLVFGDEPALASDPEPVVPAAEPPRVDAAAWEPRAPRRRRPVLRGAVAVGSAIVIAVGVAVVIGSDHHAPSRVVVQPPASPTKPAHPKAAPKPQSAKVPEKPVSANTPVVPAVATSAGNGTVTVAVPFSLTLVSTGPCWVSVRSSTGQTLYEGTLYAGQRQQVAGSGPLVIRLGNTQAITLQLNGAQLDLSGVAHTADVQFVTA